MHFTIRRSTFGSPTNVCGVAVGSFNSDFCGVESLSGSVGVSIWPRLRYKNGDIFEIGATPGCSVEIL